MRKDFPRGLGVNLSFPTLSCLVGFSTLHLQVAGRVYEPILSPSLLITYLFNCNYIISQLLQNIKGLVPVSWWIFLGALISAIMQLS